MQSVKGLQLLPNFATEINIEDAEKTLAELYMEDLPSPETFRAELDRWQRRWQSARSQSFETPKAISETLSQRFIAMYPNIRTVLELLHVIPATTATVERANSSLKYIKTNLRSRMLSPRLNALCFCIYTKTYLWITMKLSTATHILIRDE